MYTISSIMYVGFSMVIIFLLLNNDTTEALKVIFLFILSLECKNLIMDLKGKLHLYRYIDRNLDTLEKEFLAKKLTPPNIKTKELLSWELRIRNLENNTENILMIFQASIAIIGVLLIIGISVFSWLIGLRQ